MISNEDRRRSVFPGQRMADFLRRKTSTLSVVGHIIGHRVGVCVIVGVGRHIRGHTNISFVNEGLRNTSVSHRLTGAFEIAGPRLTPEHRCTLHCNESTGS